MFIIYTSCYTMGCGLSRKFNPESTFDIPQDLLLDEYPMTVPTINIFSVNLTQPGTKNTCSFVRPKYYSTCVEAIVPGNVQLGKRSEPGYVPYSKLYCPRYCTTEEDTWPECLKTMSNTLEIKECDFNDISKNIKEKYSLDKGLLQFASYLDYWTGKCKKVTRHFDAGDVS